MTVALGMMGGGVLTGDDWQRWGGGNGPTQWRSKATAELPWLGRASMSPTVGGEDRGGEAQSKRVERRGCGRAHQGGGGKQWNGDSPVGQRGHETEEREEGATDCLSARSRGRT
jgi:hypothetical protein